jgi:A-factor type gamma-butyrolactone 1'-reductase (1S-forming)
LHGSGALPWTLPVARDMRQYDLANKVALIVGASRGIGAATAQAFAREGAHLVLASRDVEAMRTLTLTFPPGTQALVLRTDLTVEAELRAAVELATSAFGRLDIAFNNGGVSQPRALLADVSIEQFDLAMNTNVRGVFIAMQYQIRAMLAGGGGVIVNTGSVASSIAMASLGAYTASKHALAGLTKAAALDYAALNIRVNLIAPGAVDTQMTRSGVLATDQGRKLIESIVPMRRIAVPEEIAEAVLWLSSPRSSYVTGAIFPVDGGYTLP